MRQLKKTRMILLKLNIYLSIHHLSKLVIFCKLAKDSFNTYNLIYENCSRDIGALERQRAICRYHNGRNHTQKVQPLGRDKHKNEIGSIRNENRNHFIDTLYFVSNFVHSHILRSTFDQISVVLLITMKRISFLF